MNSLARLPLDPKAWSESERQRPSDTVKVARNEPVVFAAARRVQICVCEASRTRTLSPG
jgi:hypothetical protein